MDITHENYCELAHTTSATNFRKGYEKFYEVMDILDHPGKIQLLHAAFGLCTEVGEFQDQLKRHLFYGKELDLTNLVEEIGDILWYVAEALEALDTPLQVAMTKNIEKLRVRFPHCFDNDHALNRNSLKEREVLDS